MVELLEADQLCLQFQDACDPFYCLAFVTLSCTQSIDVVLPEPVVEVVDDLSDYLDVD